MRGEKDKGRAKKTRGKIQEKDRGQGGYIREGKALRKVKKRRVKKDKGEG